MDELIQQQQQLIDEKEKINKRQEKRLEDQKKRNLQHLEKEQNKRKAIAKLLANEKKTGKRSVGEIIIEKGKAKRSMFHQVYQTNEKYEAQERARLEKLFQEEQLDDLKKTMEINQAILLKAKEIEKHNLQIIESLSTGDLPYRGPPSPQETIMEQVYETTTQPSLRRAREITDLEEQLPPKRARTTTFVPSREELVPRIGITPIEKEGRQLLRVTVEPTVSKEYISTPGKQNQKLIPNDNQPIYWDFISKTKFNK